MEIGAKIYSVATWTICRVLEAIYCRLPAILSKGLKPLQVAAMFY